MNDSFWQKQHAKEMADTVEQYETFLKKEAERYTALQKESFKRKRAMRSLAKRLHDAQKTNPTHNCTLSDDSVRVLNEAVKPAKKHSK